MKTYRIFATKHLTETFESLETLTDKEVYARFNQLAQKGYTEIIIVEID